MFFWGYLLIYVSNLSLELLINLADFHLLELLYVSQVFLDGVVGFTIHMSIIAV